MPPSTCATRATQARTRFSEIARHAARSSWRSIAPRSSATCSTRWDWLRTDRRPGSCRRAIRQLAFRTIRQRAARTLDSLGWKRGADGLRARGKTPLAFALMVSSSSAIRLKIAVLLQEQWRKAGANVRIEQLELNTFGGRMEDRKFDALLNAWHIDPTPSSVREEWASSEIKKGGYNATSYRSPAFDAVIDSAVTRDEPVAERSALSARVSHSHRRRARDVDLRAAQRAGRVEANSSCGNPARCVVGRSCRLVS